MAKAPSALDQIRDLYDKLPTVQCKQLCSHSCTPVTMSHAEAAEVGLPRSPTPNTGVRGPLGVPRCGLLTTQKTCSVYQARPMICRLWGIAESMPCPHGCIPEPGWLSDADTLDFLLRSWVIGGHSMVTDNAVTAFMLRAVREPGLATLALRAVQGDQVAAAAIYAKVRRAASMSPSVTALPPEGLL